MPSARPAMISSERVASMRRLETDLLKHIAVPTGRAMEVGTSIPSNASRRRILASSIL